MTNKYKKEREEMNRRIYGSKSLAELKIIGKKKGLLNVDQYKKKDKNVLIERLVKGKQLSDEDKNVLLEVAKNKGLKANTSESKEDILKKISSPKLTDFKGERLRELAEKRGISLRTQMTESEIIKRLENPTAYYTIKSLKRLADNNNIEVERNIKLPKLINILAERNLITTTPIQVQEINLGVLASKVPIELIRKATKKARNAKEAVANFKEYIKNINKDYITPTRLNKLSKQLERKIKKAEEEQKRIFIPTEEASALKKYTTQYIIKGVPYYGALEFLKGARPAILNILDSNRNIKTSLYLNCLMKRTDIDGFTAIKPFAFHSKGQNLILEDTDINEIYEEMTDEIEEEIQKIEEAEGTGWVFVEVENLTLHISKWDPLNAGSYIELPPALKNKGAIINMKNQDDECFKWCVLRALNPTDSHPERIDKDLKSKQESINMKGIKYPVSSRGIDHFESQNPEISISLLGYNKDGGLYPLKISKDTRRKHNITLLSIKDGENSHYCLIKNISALLTSQINNYKGTRNICLNCFSGFNTQESLNKHKDYCYSNECVKIVMPPPGTLLKFKNFLHSEKAPFSIYADFESLIKSLHSCDPDPNKSYTKKCQKHKPISICYFIKSFNESVYESRLRTYTKTKEEEPEAEDIFIKWLEEDVKAIANIKPKDMIFTKENEQQFNKALNCWICGESLGNDRVRDHCHYTGKYRGAAHNSCNLKYRTPKSIPVFFHNLSGYDSHLFIKRLGCTDNKKETINCIAKNEEQYISFSKTIITGQYKNKKGEVKDKTFKIDFKDSYKFMSSSLEALVKNLPKDAFKNLLKYFTPEQAELLKQKGFYPYEYMDSIKKFNDPNPPTHRAFYSKLSGKGISKKNYNHVWNVWNTFNMKIFKEYHELYNETDVLLLADVFENFRDLCLKIYGLDPVYYYTAPGLAWDACLKMTNIDLELLSDPDMLLMFEKGIRGGISIISNRYGEANNKYMKRFYKDKLIKYLMYLDANNLYGCAMSMKLPTHGFKWLTSGEMKKLFNNQILQVWEEIPCILEVDLEYPERLHDLHNDYPLFPERVKCKNGVEKLIPNLRDKTKYTIHYKNLIQCLQMGMKLKKIHRGIKFIESDWLKPYIEMNTQLRTKAKNNFEKDFYKLMNNSVFGKTMENIRNRVDVKLVNTQEKFKKLVAKPNYKGRKIFSENLLSVHMKKTKLTMNKPIYLGMCILDLSKTIMYDFHYNYIKPKYGNKAKLLFTDTDSLMYEIETEDFYKDISEDVRDRFDTSDYPENHPSGIPTGINKKVLGMFKDEVAGKNIKEFVGLRAKLYSFITEEGEENKKCKGVKRQVVENSIRHEDYKTCLTTGKEILRKQTILRSYEHEIYTEEVNKIALSAQDDKRYILSDGVHTLAWGHYKIKDL